MNDPEKVLTIGGCPCDIDVSYFQDMFLPQFMLAFPEAKFNLISSEIQCFKQKGSALSCRVLVLFMEQSC